MSTEDFYTLMKSLAKIDKFFIVWILIFVLLGGMTLFTFRTIFTAFVTAYEIEEGVSTQVEIKTQDLQEAHDFALDREESQLNVGQ